jgi:hypothetical protein
MKMITKRGRMYGEHAGIHGIRSVPQSVTMDQEVLNLCQHMCVGRGREAYRSKLSRLNKELVLASPEGY